MLYSESFLITWGVSSLEMTFSMYFFFFFFCERMVSYIDSSVTKFFPNDNVSDLVRRRSAAYA